MVDISLTMVLQWLNFAVLLFLLTRLLYKPMINFLDRRREEIQKDYDRAQSTREEAEKLLAGYREKMNAADQEARNILFEARREGMERREKIISSAQEAGEKIIEKANDEISLLEKKARRQLREETVGISISVAEKILEKEIDRADQERFIKNYIKELEKTGD